MNFIILLIFYILLIFLNNNEHFTRNMSYDLRGDPYIIPKHSLFFNYSTLQPIYNKNIYINDDVVLLNHL